MSKKIVYGKNSISFQTIAQNYHKSGTGNFFGTPVEKHGFII